MRVGILGTGFGAHHARLYKKLDDIHSIKIFGRNREKLDQINEEMGIETTDRMDDILMDTDIGVIDVCLPSSLHKKYVIEALKNGKHVFCETPVALNLADAKAMKEAEKKYKKRVFVNQFIKHEHPYEYVYDVLEGGTLGKLKALQVRRRTPSLWGDLGLNKITTEFMIHDFDFVTWLLGSPDHIFSNKISGKEGQAHVQALLKYDDTIVEMEGSSMMPDYHPFTVGYEAVFEEGTIEYKEDGYEHSVEAELKIFTNNKSEKLEIPEKDCYEEAVKHVIECCKKDIPTRLGLDDAMKSLDIALRIDNHLPE